ncbi:MAG: 50S ribosomal protein L40e [Candidatus Methanofastidiosa archaeon]|nr:50S ribosomal protein L40e [Candidatus Methanofastidiosa archaeon]MDD4281239.1 50S ribosomal protein L40e [Candidatus Methanofastidiosa archaeon]
MRSPIAEVRLFKTKVCMKCNARNGWRAKVCRKCGSNTLRAKAKEKRA